MARICGECGKRPAIFKYKGRIKADADHHVCLKCFRSMSESNFQKEINMDEAKHIYGTRISEVPNTVKELHDYVLKLEQRLEALEEKSLDMLKKAVSEPEPTPETPITGGTDTVQ